MIRLDDLASKIEWEGGLGEALSYFGREVNSESIDVNAAWRVAYDALRSLESLIPEPGEDSEDDQ